MLSHNYALVVTLGTLFKKLLIDSNAPYWLEQLLRSVNNLQQSSGKLSGTCGDALLHSGLGQLSAGPVARQFVRHALNFHRVLGSAL